jgi:hypothetical protein
MFGNVVAAVVRERAVWRSLAVDRSLALPVGATNDGLQRGHVEIRLKGVSETVVVASA